MTARDASAAWQRLAIWGSVLRVISWPVVVRGAGAAAGGAFERCSNAHAQQLKNMMQPAEIQLISQLINQTGASSYFEWGTGGSTDSFPRALPRGGRAVAVENFPAWCSRVRAAPFASCAIAAGALEYRCLAPENETVGGAGYPQRGCATTPTRRAPGPSGPTSTRSARTHRRVGGMRSSSTVASASRACSRLSSSRHPTRLFSSTMRAASSRWTRRASRPSTHNCALQRTMRSSSASTGPTLPSRSTMRSQRARATWSSYGGAAARPAPPTLPTSRRIGATPTGGGLNVYCVPG